LKKTSQKKGTIFSYFFKSNEEKAKTALNSQLNELKNEIKSLKLAHTDTFLSMLIFLKKSILYFKF